MKFGGTSVADQAAFARVARIVRARRDELPVVVVSAMSGVTDALLRSTEIMASGNVGLAIAALDGHLARHLDVARALANKDDAARFETTVTEKRGELRGFLRKLEHQQANWPFLTDEILSLGEQLSATLLAFVLQAFDLPAVYLDARRVVVTDSEHGRANPLMAETASRAGKLLFGSIAQGKVPVLGGFIGASASGETTTLGRGGSDYSAAIVGAALDAREIQIWTDVSGVLTADPRIVPTARTIPVLSYREAAELAYFGAKVLHPKTIQPAIDKCIPVRVCNSRRPEEPGTLIVTESEAAPQTVKAIAHKNGITTVQVTSARMLGAYGFLRALFEVFDRHRTPVDVVTTSEVSVSLSLDETSALPEIVRELEELGRVEVEGRRAIISVIGEGLLNTPGIAARVFSTISDINVAMISVGASSVNLTFMVDQVYAGEAIRRLHRGCFEIETPELSAAGVEVVGAEVGA
jgi:aspartate kinase